MSEDHRRKRMDRRGFGFRWGYRTVETRVHKSLLWIIILCNLFCQRKTSHGTTHSDGNFVGWQAHLKLQGWRVLHDLRAGMRCGWLACVCGGSTLSECFKLISQPHMHMCCRCCRCLYLQISQQTTHSPLCCLPPPLHILYLVECIRRVSPPPSLHSQRALTSISQSLPAHFQHFAHLRFM